jgi:outer membrane cobalamin receptor
MFGQHNPDSIPMNLLTFKNWTGFKAYNISNAQITGVDITVTGHGKLFGWPATLLTGYTYTNPIDLNVTKDSNYVKNSTQSQILKYRFYHSAKADLEVTHLRFSGGISLDYHSYIINIDKAFEDTIRFMGQPMQNPDGTPLMILPGLKEYRDAHHIGDVVFNARFSYQITENSKMALIVKNIFNREYMIRPADVQAPRTIAVQYALKF